jgi:hypothetical protein
VQEIAEVLAREQGKPIDIKIWEEALSLHRVRYETEVLRDPEQDSEQPQRLPRGHWQRAKNQASPGSSSLRRWPNAHRSRSSVGRL